MDVHSQFSIAYTAHSDTVQTAVIPGESPIHIFKLADFSRGTIDVWRDAMLSRMDAWDAGEFPTWLALHDVSAVRVLSTLTPYSKTVFNELSANWKHLNGKVCFVISANAMFTKMGERVVRGFIGAAQPLITPHVVRTTEDGLAWLLKE